MRTAALFALVVAIGLGLGAGIGRLTAATPPATRAANAVARTGSPSAGSGVAPAGGPNGPALTGRVTSLTGDSLVIDSASRPVTVTLGVDTRVTLAEPATRADVVVGEQVAALADGAGDSPTAITITLSGAGVGPDAGASGKVGRPSRDPTGDHIGGPAGTRQVMGHIASSDGDQLAITTPAGETRRVTLTDSTQIQRGRAGSVGDLETGWEITVTGEPGADGSLQARTIRARRP